MESKNNAKTARGRKAKSAVPPVMSMSELAKLGGGKIAYIKVMTADEAKEMFPAVEGIPTGINLYRPARRRRHADCADRQPPVGRSATPWATSWRSPACTEAWALYERSRSDSIDDLQGRPARKVRAFRIGSICRRARVPYYRVGSGGRDASMDSANAGTAGDPRGRRELGGVARRRRLGALPHRLARRRAHDGDLVPGPGRGVHRGEPRRLRARASASCISSAATRSISPATAPSRRPR